MSRRRAALPRVRFGSDQPGGFRVAFSGGAAGSRARSRPELMLPLATRGAEPTLSPRHASRTDRRSTPAAGFRAAAAAAQRRRRASRLPDLAANLDEEVVAAVLSNRELRLRAARLTGPAAPARPRGSRSRCSAIVGSAGAADLQKRVGLSPEETDQQT